MDEMGISFDPAQLRRVAALALDEPAARLVDWQVKLLTGGMEVYNRLYHFSGQAETPSGMRPWSLVLKTVSCDETTDRSPQAFRYWQREALFYQSGLADSLSCGVAAPRCYETSRDGDITLIWLEKVDDNAPDPWSLEHYREAARLLGCFNGAYLAGRLLPDAPWLSQRWLRKYVENAASIVRDVPGLRKLPFFQASYPHLDDTFFAEAWERRGEFLDALERLPQTYCHLDAFERNLYWRELLDGQMQLVGLDWAFTGIASVGEEVSPLVAMAFSIPGSERMKLFDLCLDGYLAGLAEAGWQGDPLQVRFASLANIFYRYHFGIFGEIWPVARDERNHTYLAARMNLPAIEMIFYLLADNNLFHRAAYEEISGLLERV